MEPIDRRTFLAASDGLNTKQMLQYALWGGGAGALHIAPAFYS